jgi:hypothetical protein
MKLLGIFIQDASVVLFDWMRGLGLLEKFGQIKPVYAKRFMMRPDKTSDNIIACPPRAQ